MAVSDNPPCQSEACAIQDCLMAKNYQETQCQDVIDRLYQCCEKMIKQNGTSTACPKPSVVDRKLREIKERK
ncbi:hypothetical protein MVLG_00035 [Microbotryum lychnidis-dioicae p1A1 Lamole]|uniref:Cx9C motif-containing protein 4, mitochondrial n=1 Tax=Microbotryum lychnidis-dioicae (strain p1A1 Lamole / MvSl-1064) TaxID=683840 RepID=U5GXV9_USTV1|nr:hypothetical protein MVLG_00035 [Microbotryum lychnidis-dioicae p1A1 Lamole]|eukprot:KDE09628.1 hypothetical protein MVLG_00035 [Microbotryum lychnidis-dioicae p1A1 Lamole]